MSILIATDLTGRSDRALQRAGLIAGAADEPLVVLHALEEEWSPAASARKRAEAENAIAESLAALPTPPRAAMPVVLEGPTPELILRHAAQARARLIVLGTRHRPSAAEVFLGTTVDNVVRSARQPVLLVRNPAPRPYTRAVAGIDFSPHGIFAAMAAMQLFQDCTWRLVNAYDVPFAGFQHGKEAWHDAQEDHRRRLHALVSKELVPLTQSTGCPGDVSMAVRRGEAIEVLRREVREMPADLLVIGTHARTGLAHALLGSVAESLLSEPPCDVLVAHATL